MRILFYLLFLAFPIGLFAQKPFLVFQEFTHKAVSENSIRFISEDSIGFLWIGSDEGLFRYDGHKLLSFNALTSQPYSVSGESMKCFFIDSQNRIWMGTRNGLNLYDPVFRKFYNYKSKDYACLSTIKGDVEDVCEDNEGNIWVTTENQGLFKIYNIHQEAKHFTYRSAEGPVFLLGIKYRHDGLLYIGTRDGLLTFDPKQEKFEDRRQSFGWGYQVKRVFKDRDGSLLLGTSNGLKILTAGGDFLQYNHDPKLPNSINGNVVESIYRLDSSRFVLALDGAGIDVFDVGKQEFYHYTDTDEAQLPSKNLTSVFVDSKKNIWAGAFMNGLYYSNSTTNLFAFYKNNSLGKGIAKGIVTYFYKDSQNNLWITTDGGGLYVIKHGEKYPVPYEPVKGQGNLSDLPLIAIFEDSFGFLWMTTYGGGLKKFKFGVNGIKTFSHGPGQDNVIKSNNLKAIQLDRSGNLWIGGFGVGASVFHTASREFKSYNVDAEDSGSLPSSWIESFHLDKKGRLWCATFNGLSLYMPEEDNFRNFNFTSSKFSEAESNFIQDICEVDDYLYLGTSGAGFIRFNSETFEYSFFGLDEGLSHNNVKSIIADNHNNLWLATSNGISKYSIIDQNIEKYTLQDGVPSSSFYKNAKYKDDEGRLWFGVSNGYISIDPALIRNNVSVPPIVLTKFSVASKHQSDYLHSFYLKENVVLKHSENAFDFEFAALNFNTSQKNMYAYMLEGFDKTWIYSGNRNSVSYTNIDPGNYIFKVKASNNDGIWNEEYASVSLTIISPWWQTWWFSGIMAILFLGSVVGVIKWRTYTISRHNRKLEAEVTERTRALKQSNEQLDAFVYKASHDIKGPLKSIIGLTQVGQKDIKDPEARNYFDHILKSTLKLDDLLQNLLQISKIKQTKLNTSQIDVLEVINESINIFSNFPGFDKLKIEVDVRQNQAFFSDKSLFQSIIQNLIENPLKYMDDKKTESYLKISGRVTAKEVCLSFKDNGIGVDKDLQEKVFEMFYKVNPGSEGTGLGLYIVKSSLDKLNGTIKFKSKVGQGSIFEIKIPNLKD
ncbi:MAG: two-component regulator propeller domain-containing protein [Cytophagaceae bacterium]